MTIRRRIFASPALQQIYDRYITDKPGAEVRGQGSCGNAYYVGRFHRHPKKPFAQRGSFAYAAWAAGVDVARWVARSKGED